MQPAASALGVLMLDTRFHRPVGDVGHSASWDCPVRFKIVGGATAGKVVHQDASALIPDFAAAAEGLVAEGARAIITSCGFMARYQDALAARISVPFGASSLLQVPLLAKTLGAGRKVGVLTYDAQSLGHAALAAVGADPLTPVYGLPRDGAFHGLIEGGQPYDRPAMEAELYAAARQMLSDHPEVGAIVLECTNMPPFAFGLRQAFGLPVQDILTLGHWLYLTTSPRSFAGF